NTSLGRVHIDYHAFDNVADVDQLRRMLHALRPSHLTDVDQAFNSLLQFDERTVVRNADDATGNVRALGITMLRVEPRIRRELLESKRDTLLLFVVLQNLHLNLIADVDQVFGVSEAAPRHVGD